jgi:hypothetical protein
MNRIKRVVSSRLTVCFLGFLSLTLYPAVASSYSDNQQYQNGASQLSQAELAQLLAPIALYPDSLLSHIMIASTYPLEVVQAYRWRQENNHLSAADAVEKAEKEGWDPSVTALVAFENVLANLNEDLNWTQTVGDAFLTDEVLVLNTIQALRVEAEKANSLNNMPHMRVVKQHQQIIIEPKHQSIVYVPYYDTRVVYGNWRWHRYPPIHWTHRSYASRHFPVNVSAHFHWGAPIDINFNYFFSGFSWHKRHLVVSHHRKARFYRSEPRSHHRITNSHGAKRWKHNVRHRRGVAYASHKFAHKQLRHTRHGNRDGYTYKTYRNHQQLKSRIKSAHVNVKHQKTRHYSQQQKPVQRQLKPTEKSHINKSSRHGVVRNKNKTVNRNLIKSKQNKSAVVHKAARTKVRKQSSVKERKRSK